MKVPFVDLKAQHDRLKEKLFLQLEKVFQTSSFIQGPFLREFENRFTALHGSTFKGAGVSNGTAAVSLALEASGIGKGDEVIIPSHTFFATAEAVFHVGAKPVFADIDPRTYQIDPAAIQKKITKRTRGIIVVHLYGNPCDMESIVKVATDFKLKLIEDCAQAHFAKIKTQFVGCFGDVGAFSFYPGKNLGACGDAGFCLSRNEDLMIKIKKLLDHGRVSKYLHELVGYNHRMDGIQAALLLVKLDSLRDWTRRRQEIAKRYDSAFRAAGFKTIEHYPTAEAVYHLYVVELENREATAQKLEEKGIATGLHYPVPLHLQPAVESLGYRKGDLPCTEKVAGRILSLPIFPEMTDEQQDYVIENFLQVAAP